MIKIVDQNRFGVVNYVVSTVAEKDKLPTCLKNEDGEPILDENGNKIHLVGQGSTAFVIEGSRVFMYNEETASWEEI